MDMHSRQSPSKRSSTKFMAGTHVEEAVGAYVDILYTHCGESSMLADCIVLSKYGSPLLRSLLRFSQVLPRSSGGLCCAVHSIPP